MKMDKNTKPIVEVYSFQELLPYKPVWELQKKWVKEIDQGVRNNSLLLLQHFPTYTIGREGKEEHILFDRQMFLAQGGELEYVDRGGDVTYHGPGQLVGYPLLELSHYKGGPHEYLRDLEEVVIRTLSRYGIQGERKSPYTGVWVQDKKICAIGVKFNRGVKKRQFITSHGFALNVCCDLSMFKKIIPCGIRQYSVTSMTEIAGKNIDFHQLSVQIVEQFAEIFGLYPYLKKPVLIS
jgi:lipoyl(octanoyl) transferase